ncbi:retrovirus-related pol polyprotein from transposon TNT 1-94 [Tanacetum coccineum]
MYNLGVIRDEKEVFDDEGMVQVKVLMVLANDEIVVGKNDSRNGEWIDITMRKVNILLSMDEDADWQNYLNLGLNEAPTDPESCKESGSVPQTPLPLLKILQGTSPSSEVMPLTYQEILKAKAKPFPPCTHYGFNGHRLDDCSMYPECEMCGSYDHASSGHNRVILVKGGVRAESSQSRESSVGKYVDQPGPKLVFGDNSSCITEGFSSINCGALRKNDVYVLDISTLTQNRVCFFAKSFESANWIWYKRLSRLNFKNINKLAKQNKVLGLPSLVYSKNKPCSTCEKVLDVFEEDLDNQNIVRVL